MVVVGLSARDDLDRNVAPQALVGRCVDVPFHRLHGLVRLVQALGAFGHGSPFGTGFASPSWCKGDGTGNLRPVVRQYLAPLSFFDEPEDFSPRGTATAPRRSGGGSRRSDRDVVRRRQILAVVIGIVLILLLFFGIRGCASIRKENAYKDYVREVSADVQQSQQESDAVFGLLRKGQAAGQSPVDLQNNINGFRAEAAKLAERARKRDAPGDVKGANRYLVDALQLRADGLGSVARLLPT